MMKKMISWFLSGLLGVVIINPLIAQCPINKDNAKTQRQTVVCSSEKCQCTCCNYNCNNCNCKQNLRCYGEECKCSTCCLQCKGKEGEKSCIAPEKSSNQGQSSTKNELKDKKQPQTLCPVMGKKIQKEFYVEHQGKRIYGCCPSCINTIRQNPEFYIHKLEQEGIVLESLQN